MKKIKNKSNIIVSFLLAFCMLIGSIGFSDNTKSFALEKTSSSSGLDAFVLSSYYNVFKDYQRENAQHCGFADGIEEKVNLVMAKNEMEGAQIIMNNEEDFIIESVEFSNLASGQNIISNDKFYYNFQEYHMMRNQEGKNNNNVRNIKEHYNLSYIPQGTVPVASVPSLVAGKTGEWFPDALSNEKSMKVKGGEAQSVLVTFDVPKDAKAGVYTGSVTVKTNAGNKVIPVEIDVVDVTVPSADQGSFGFEFWYMTTMYWKHGKVPVDTIGPMFGVEEYEKYSENWWRIMDDMCKLLNRARVNVIYILPWVMVIDAPGTKIEGDDPKTYEYTFDFSVLKEFLDFFTSRIDCNRITANHLFIPQQNIVYMIDKDVQTGELFMNRTASANMGNSPGYGNWDKGVNYLTQWTKQLGAFLTENKWNDMFLQHINDEPGGAIKNTYKLSGELITKNMPGAIYGDAFYGNSLNELNILIEAGAKFLSPHMPVYQNHIARFQELQEQGYEVVPYTMLTPTGSSLNRSIEKPVWNMRTISWITYQWGANGHLHANANTWFESTNANVTSPDKLLLRFFEPASQNTAGDMVTIYPDTVNATVKSSIRLEAIRDGSEEYEILNILGGVNEQYARDFTRNTVTRINDFETNKEVLKRNRELLLKTTEQALKSGKVELPSVTAATSSNGAVSVTMDKDCGYDISIANLDAVYSIDGGADQNIVFKSIQKVDATHYNLTFDPIANYTENNYSVVVKIKGQGNTEYLSVAAFTVEPKPVVVPEFKPTIMGAYEFDSAETVSNDCTAFNRDFKSLGSAVFSESGKYGGGLHFDGSNFATLASSVYYVSNFTLNVWVKADDSSLFTTPGEKQYIVAQQGTTGRGPVYLENFAGTVKVVSYIGNGEGTTFSKTAILPNTWYMITIQGTATTGNQVRHSLGVNGVIEDTVNNSCSSSSSDIVIGAHKNGSMKYKGSIDSLYFYANELNAEQLIALYTGKLNNASTSESQMVVLEDSDIVVDAHFARLNVKNIKIGENVVTEGFTFNMYTNKLTIPSTVFGGQSNKLTINLENGEQIVIDISIEKLKFTFTNITDNYKELTVSDTFVIDYETNYDKNIIIESLNTDIVEIGADGALIAKKVGIAVIKIHTQYVIINVLL